METDLWYGVLFAPFSLTYSTSCLWVLPLKRFRIKTLYNETIQTLYASLMEKPHGPYKQALKDDKKSWQKLLLCKEFRISSETNAN